MKKRIGIIIIIIGALAFAIGPLKAEGSEDLFRKKQMFIELYGGSGTARSPSLDYWKDSEFNTLHAYTMLSATNSKRNLLGIYELSQPKGSVESKNGRAEIEYAVTDWLGLGGSLNSSSIQINNAVLNREMALLGVALQSSASSIPYASLIATNFIGSSANPTVIDFLASEKGKISMSKINTIDFDLGFHFPGSSRLDPFFKLTVGTGTVNDESIIKGGAILGLRIQPAPHFNIIVDAATNVYSFNHENVTETLGHIGVGTSF